MVFQWYGGDTLQIMIKRREGEDVSLVTDPCGATAATALPRSLKADIVVGSFAQSPKDLQCVSSSQSDQSALAINSSGEYERKAFFITGIDGAPLGEKERSTLYRFDVEELSIGYLTGITEKLNSEQLALFEGAHILVVPVGGSADGIGVALDIVWETVQAIDPSIVIAVRTRTKDSPQWKGIEAFAKASGIEPRQEEGSVKITRADLLEDQTMTVIAFDRP